MAALSITSALCLIPTLWWIGSRLYVPSIVPEPVREREITVVLRPVPPKGW